MLQYGVGGYDINLGIDKASHDKIKQANQDFTYELEMTKDDDGNITGQRWKKVAVENKGFGSKSGDSTKDKAEKLQKKWDTKDERLATQRWSGQGPNYPELAKNGIMHSDVDKAKKMLDAAQEHQVRGFFTNEVDDIKIQERGGRLYAIEDDPFQEEMVEIINDNGILKLVPSDGSTPIAIQGITDDQLKSIF